MKKLTTIIILFIFVTAIAACSKKMDTRTTKGKNVGMEDGKNKTEGYFYHQPEENLNSDSTQVKKNVKN